MFFNFYTRSKCLATLYSLVVGNLKVVVVKIEVKDVY